MDNEPLITDRLVSLWVGSEPANAFRSHYVHSQLASAEKPLGLSRNGTLESMDRFLDP
jgi:hypothetical protein